MAAQSVTGRILSLDRWTVAMAVLFLVIAVGRFGPESYFGLDDDVYTWGIIALFLVWLVARRSMATGTGVETPADGPVAVGQHYRPSGDATGDLASPGVYRVVGAGDPVALLRVADADGRRVHSGELRTVDASTVDADFEPATDPDAGLAPVRGLRNYVSGLYWLVRGLR